MLFATWKIESDIFLKFKTCSFQWLIRNWSKKLFILKKFSLKKSTIFSILFFKASFESFPGLSTTWNIFNRWNKCLNFKKVSFRDYFFPLVFTKWLPNYKIFTNTCRIFFVTKYKQTEEITKNNKFLESLKEYVWIFLHRCEQLFNFANSIIFAKSKNCSKHPEKICMYSLTNFKNFLFLVIFAISLLLSRKTFSISSKVPQYIPLIELRRCWEKLDIERQPQVKIVYD